jgi:nucleotide-binding universal stress UspA family protein
MSIKAILAVADGGSGTKGALETALLIARRCNASVDVVHVRADVETMVPVIGEGMSGAMVEQMMSAMAQSIDARAAKARAVYDEVGPKSGAKTVWREMTGREPDVVAAAGRLSDLIVIGRPDNDAETPLAATLDAALFDTGRPVLVAPATPPGAIGKTIALAWNGSAQSARVVAGALPLFSLSERVIVMTVGEIDPLATASELVSYLSRHDIRAVHQAIEPGHESVGKSLLHQAEKAGADMLAMGAYGHSRLREMILGGATRHVLVESNIPVLMAH